MKVTLIDQVPGALKMKFSHFYCNLWIACSVVSSCLDSVSMNALDITPLVPGSHLFLSGDFSLFQLGLSASHGLAQTSL